jgi:hypothetical protein
MPTHPVCHDDDDLGFILILDNTKQSSFFSLTKPGWVNPATFNLPTPLYASNPLHFFKPSLDGTNGGYQKVFA